MTNVIAFPQADSHTRQPRVAATGSVTLFVHVRRTTLIAHMSRRPVMSAKADERISQS